MFIMLRAIPIWPHRYPEAFISKIYSDYKSGTTLKGLIACDPMVNIVFVSDLFTGSMSNVVPQRKVDSTSFCINLW